MGNISSEPSPYQLFVRQGLSELISYYYTGPARHMQHLFNEYLGRFKRNPSEHYHRPHSLETIQIIPFREPEVRLRNESAQFFYDAYFKGKTKIYWSDFWAGVSEVILADGIIPTESLEIEVEDASDKDQTGIVTIAQLEDFFDFWDDERNRQEAVARAQITHHLKYLLGSSQQGYNRNLIMRLTDTNPEFPFDLRLNESITISSQGLINSRRRARDGITRFGTRSGLTNDVNFNPEDPDLSPHLFQILSCGDGYHIVDSVNFGIVLMKLLPRQRYELRKGSLIDIGPKITLEVLECVYSLKLMEPDDMYGFHENAPVGCPSISLRVVRGERFGEPFKLTVSPTTNQFVIGQSSESIEFNELGVSLQHSLIEFVRNRWEIIDLDSTTGTWLNLMNKEESYFKVPSKTRRLKVGDIVLLKHYRFEVTQA